MPYAAMPMQFDAFISYASADKTAADAACAVLEAAGIRCWVAPRDISPGLEYGAAIIDAIDRCRVMVLIFSSSANDSPQVRREIERAASKGVAILPVRIEEVLPTKSMEYFLGDIHWLDAMTPPIEKHLQQLAVTIKALLNASAAAANETLGGVARFDPKYPARSGWLFPVIGGVVSVALLLGGAWLYQNRASKPMPEHSVPSQPSEPKQESKKVESLLPEQVPFISDRARATIRNTYLPADDHKALAISLTQIGFITGQADDDAAKAAALDNCRRATDADGHRDFRCDLYALGNAVVYTGTHPPLPPQPWFVLNTSVERPFDAVNLPLVGDRTKTMLVKEYGDAAKTKALALSPTGAWSYVRGQSSPEEAIRRALEWCGRHGAPCMIVAVDDRFVVAIPTTMKGTGFFQANTNALIVPELRSDVARRLGNVITGWSAVAVGIGGGPGLALGALSEQAAVDRALGDCSTRDRNCHVIAIGPFLVDPTQAPTLP
jgi:TIR domain-containing protein